jgi:hypothetical protein
MRLMIYEYAGRNLRFQQGIPSLKGQLREKNEWGIVSWLRKKNLQIVFKIIQKISFCD